MLQVPGCVLALSLVPHDLGTWEDSVSHNAFHLAQRQQQLRKHVRQTTEV